ncbi:Receptor-like protein 12 [Morella rubra]|uniref:Receptor-like protein 12 n=1 Tax=Morella rubra TaxID=262757 RepID=A0A6A1V985_9ROSI|nr:Receptor-like protein 12 [Morella rubra]
MASCLCVWSSSSHGFFFYSPNSFSSLQLLCHEDESSALMQFKHRFVINKSVSSYPFAYPKVASWKNNSDCCSWDGVECSEDTGHVVSLDLSSSCLYGNFSRSLEVLSLQNNNFYGIIPKGWAKGANLKLIDLSENQLQGQLPRSLVHCPMLEFLHVGDNEIHDTFPFWLGTLAQLKILVLRSNRFHGVINDPETNDTFPKLRIIDLSHNDFSGNLPSRFRGEIPEAVGNLTALQSLNFSNNGLTGHIPSSLGNLKNLEALDLAQNKLVGEIPLELVQLNFLAVFNVSNNSLTGPIPSGKQFDTFQISSFEHNPGLCGKPLSKTCGDSSLQRPSIFEENQGSKSLFQFDWKVVVIGYGCGLVVGIFIGQIMIPKEHDWFVRIFRKKQQTRGRVKGRK